MTTSTIDFIGATVRVPYVGQGVINDSRTLDSKTYYAVDIPLNGKNARVWRQSKDLHPIEILIKAAPICDDTAPSSDLDVLKVAIPSQPLEKPLIAELTIITPELIDPTAQRIRDAEPPFVPVLRLFRAQVVVTRLELCA